jgi:cytochrome c peroxidase
LPVFNLYTVHSYMADGRAPDLPTQHLMPLQLEMQVDWPRALQSLASDQRAARLFAAAGAKAPTKPEVVNALAAYVMTLVSGNSRFDRFFYSGDAGALSDQEQRGLRIFMRRGRCATCHLVDGFAAPFTDGGYHSVGVGFTAHGYADHGRRVVTGRLEDDGLFRTPTLRNVAQRHFFMHNGSLTSLTDVVRYYNQGGVTRALNQDPRIQKLYLTDTDIADLVAFMNSLTSPVERLVHLPDKS